MPSRNPASTANVMGHPLHPMLIPFPIAFLVENRAGANGNIAMDAAVKAPPAFDYPQFGRSAISIPSSMSARRESPRQRTMTPGGGSRERPRWPPRRASLRT